MRTFFNWTFLLVAAAVLTAAPVKAQTDAATEDPETEKLAQTGFKFLTIPVDARGAAIADALTAFDLNSSVAMFYNPASMARLGSTIDVAVGQTRWLGDIDYNIASIAFRPANGRYGVIGVSLTSVNYGSIKGTIRADNEQGYLDYSDIGLSNPSPSALAIGVGYAQALTDRFSVGANIKFAQQDLEEGVLSASETGYNVTDNSKSTLAFDFGVLYNTGFRSLNFAMSVRNFARELTYVEENFELPLTFRIGVMMDLLDLSSMDRDLHSFRLAIDAERPRDFAEQLKIGGEYVFMNTLALRAGYTFPTDLEGVNLGAGVQHTFGGLAIGADYAFTTYDVFDNVHRLALHLSF